MSLITYPVIADERHERFEFLSEGPRGKIKKVVEYERMAANIYNLAFGDLNAKTNGIDDKVRSNNQDGSKVIMTVASTVIRFIEHHPQAIVVAEGSTPARTRLYQMGISKNWHIITHLFTVKGLFNDMWEDFTLDKNYRAFLLEAKK